MNKKIKTKENLDKKNKPNGLIGKIKNQKFFKSKISIIIIVLVILAIISLLVFLGFMIFGKKMPPSNESMDAYGFSKLYNNGTCTETENITKSEALKVIIGATLNRDNILDLIEPSLFLENYTGLEEDISGLLEYNNQVWVEYAKSFSIVPENEISKENEAENVSYLDLIIYLANAKKNLLNLTLNTDKQPSKIKSLETFNATAQIAIKDMVANEIIEDKDVDFTAKATKGQLNDMIVKFVNEYNTLTINGEKININPNKIPSNSAEYPYTLATVDKKVYEMGNYKKDETLYKTPIQFYAESKQDYYKIDEIVTTYLNTLLNLNYESINESEFITNMSKATGGNIDTNALKNYLQFVKDNHIKVSGTSKVQYPAIYFDGEKIRVRTKIEYTVENADNLENILYGDEHTEGITYKKQKYEEIIDVPVNYISDGHMIFMSIFAISDAKAENVKDTVLNNNSSYYNNTSSNGNEQNSNETSSQFPIDGI